MTKLPKGKSRLDLVREGHRSKVKMGGRKIVSLTKLSEDPKNERKTFRNMEGLTQSIKSLGVIEPITVQEVGEDHYQIITGHRRFRAAKGAGLKQIEIIVRDEEDALSTRKKSIVSNVQREDVGPIELAEALQSLLDEDDSIKTQRDLAAAVSKPEDWVSAMLKVLSLPPEDQRKIQSSPINFSYDSAIKIARLPDDKKEEKSALIDAVIAGTPVREIRERIKTVSGKKKSSGATIAKPKMAYKTKQDAVVVVQSENENPLSNQRLIAALKEALAIAKKR